MRIILDQMCNTVYTTSIYSAFIGVDIFLSPEKATSALGRYLRERATKYGLFQGQRCPSFLERYRTTIQATECLKENHMCMGLCMERWFGIM